MLSAYGIWRGGHCASPGRAHECVDAAVEKQAEFLGAGGLLETNEFDIHFQQFAEGKPVVPSFLLIFPLLGGAIASSPDDAAQQRGATVQRCGARA